MSLGGLCLVCLANTEVIRELIKSVLHNFVENTANCPNYSFFGEYLDRKGPCSSEPDTFCMAAGFHSLFIPFLLFCHSEFLVPSLPGFLKVTMQLGSFSFYRALRCPLSAQTFLSQAAGTGKQERQT